jgi:serine/threonine protein phosphatase 1
LAAKPLIYLLQFIFCDWFKKDDENRTMRTVVVGDIHGCYAELIRLLDAVQLKESDRLISLGDMVDRGPNSIKVYDYLRNRPNTIVLMGNHERKHLRRTLSYSQDIVKLQFGDRYPEFLDWIAHLPYYHETENAILVHAAVENGLPVSAQNEEVLCGCVISEQHFGNQYGKMHWSQFYEGTKPVIFGHHRVGNEPLIRAQKIYGIDTGACHGGRLTALILPDFAIAQVQSPQDYWLAEREKWQVPVLTAKPWNSYKWQTISALCNDFKYSANAELAAVAVQKQKWMKHLLALAPQAIAQVETKLAEFVATHGADDFKEQVRHLTYATLLDQANSSPLTPDFLQQALPTPDQWLQVMRELEIAI